MSADGSRGSPGRKKEGRRVAWPSCAFAHLVPEFGVACAWLRGSVNLNFRWLSDSVSTGSGRRERGNVIVNLDVSRLRPGFSILIPRWMEISQLFGGILSP